MRFPRQVAPLKRPELVRPHELVDVEHGSAEELVAIRVDLTHGANFNDPPPWNGPLAGLCAFPCGGPLTGPCLCIRW